MAFASNDMMMEGEC